MLFCAYQYEWNSKKNRVKMGFMRSLFSTDTENNNENNKNSACCEPIGINMLQKSPYNITASSIIFQVLLRIINQNKEEVNIEWYFINVYFKQLQSTNIHVHPKRRKERFSVSFFIILMRYAFNRISACPIENSSVSVCVCFFLIKKNSRDF